MDLPCGLERPVLSDEKRRHGRKMSPLPETLRVCPRKEYHYATRNRPESTTATKSKITKITRFLTRRERLKQGVLTFTDWFSVMLQIEKIRIVDMKTPTDVTICNVGIDAPKIENRGNVNSENTRNGNTEKGYSVIFQFQ